MKNITYKNDSYEIPFKITCTVSGVTKVYTSEEYINKKLDRFGGLENLRKTYVCRDAKRAAKAVKTILGPLADTTTPAVDPVKVEQNETLGMFAHLITESKNTLALPAPRPIAKMDKNGKYRNEKGHLISKANLDQYTLAAA